MNNLEVQGEHPNNTVKNAYANNLRKGMPEEQLQHLENCQECREEMYPEKYFRKNE